MLNKKTFLFAIFLSLCLGVNVFSQTVAGKIYGKEEANKLYGPVLESMTIPVEKFKTMVEKAGASMLFNFEKGSLYIFNEKRASVFSNGGVRAFTSNAVMKRYSVSVINQLLTKGNNSSVVIEKRQNVLSVTVGEYTMESSVDCPPYCTIE